MYLSVVIYIFSTIYTNNDDPDDDHNKTSTSNKHTNVWHTKHFKLNVHLHDWVHDALFVQIRTVHKTAPPAWFWWGWGRSWPGSRIYCARSGLAWRPPWAPCVGGGAHPRPPGDTRASWSASCPRCTGRLGRGSSRATRGSAGCCWPAGGRPGRPTPRCCRTACWVEDIETDKGRGKNGTHWNQFICVIDLWMNGCVDLCVNSLRWCTIYLKCLWTCVERVMDLLLIIVMCSYLYIKCGT